MHGTHFFTKKRKAEIQLGAIRNQTQMETEWRRYPLLAQYKKLKLQNRNLSFS